MFSLRITDIEPIPHDLIFKKFLMHAYAGYAAMCRFIGTMKGTENSRLGLLAQVGCYIEDHSNCVVYDEEWLTIVVDTTSLAFVCYRKENNNPVLSADEKGKLVRAHGEASHLRDHLLSLMQSILKEMS